ncbi:unnamed protein product [Cylicocyclus nassatus]|uniref:Methyltransferase domain-containing protein n=1 Tax=Cylicocyclus nassatus TaxID=53992 RepID=A0AA36MC63_CYLNA|nr:unnamed protein product [Cylicocyclus nassatus]
MQRVKPTGCTVHPTLRIMVGIVTIAVILMVLSVEETPAQQLPSSIYNGLTDLGGYVKKLSRIETGPFPTLLQVQCPNLVRVGSVVDGGKYVCNPQAIDTQKCRIYSLGLMNEISFDVEIQNITGNTCKIYGYDQHEQSKGIKDAYSRMNGKLKAVFISNEKGKRIQDFFDENGDNFADILKIDIEGAEHNVLIPFLSDEKYKVCQVLIEIHGQGNSQLHLLVSIAKQGYALFSYEVNGWTMAACEYSFIHMSCLKQYGAVELKRYLPPVK